MYFALKLSALLFDLTRVSLAEFANGFKSLTPHFGQISALKSIFSPQAEQNLVLLFCLILNPHLSQKTASRSSLFPHSGQ